MLSFSVTAALDVANMASDPNDITHVQQAMLEQWDNATRPMTIATTKPVREMTPEDLQTLATDPAKVPILWERDDSLEPWKSVSTDYPASVAYALSKYCALRIQSGDAFSLTMNSQLCDYKGACDVFEWMLEYCKTNNSASLLSFHPHPFSRILKLLDAARGINVEVLEERLQHVLAQLHDTVPSAEDLAAVLEFDVERRRIEDNRDETIRNFMVKHMANAIISGRLSETDSRHSDIFKVLKSADNHIVAAMVERMVEPEKNAGFRDQAIEKMNWKADFLASIRRQQRTGFKEELTVERTLARAQTAREELEVREGRSEETKRETQAGGELSERDRQVPEKGKIATGGYGELSKTWSEFLIYD